MAPWKRRGIGCAIASLLYAATPASAQTVQIGSLTDLSFGTISSVATSQTVSETLCVYSSVTNYTVRATGSGTGGAFTLANGGAQMPYMVQWASSGSQTSGTQLTAGAGVRFTPSVLNLLCSLGSLLAGSASLIVTLPPASLSAAQAGTYTGTLTLLVSPN